MDAAWHGDILGAISNDLHKVILYISETQQHPVDKTINAAKKVRGEHSFQLGLLIIIQIYIIKQEY